ncbi:MAG TPA: carboxypeptidase-like regulatory domain-containing protein [Puia sp.]|nr:carboxypeptidase-like regulatory domain-containing protein [Puia sp.]
MLTLLILLCQAQLVRAQVEITGTIYDKTQHFALPGVSVLGASGIGTTTDSTGRYRIRLSAKDSIYFSYLGKVTSKYPVKEISYPEQFDMSLQVNIDSLAPVYVRSRSYELDSLENRMEYRKIFDYGGPDVVNSYGSGPGVSSGIDFDLLFNGKKNRRMLAFQSRLLFDEREKYIDHRFSRYLVKRITGLESPALDSFMRQYRPSYDFIQSFYNDYDYYEYILTASKYFMLTWRQEHGEPEEQAGH